MKKFICTVALAALALMPLTAQARVSSSSSDRRGNSTRVEKIDKKNRKGHGRHGHDMKMDRKRPTRGTRFSARPIGGKYYKVGHETLWLCDGVLYREITIGGGRKVFVVVDYLF